MEPSCFIAWPLTTKARKLGPWGIAWSQRQYQWSTAWFDCSSTSSSQAICSAPFSYQQITHWGTDTVLNSPDRLGKITAARFITRQAQQIAANRQCLQVYLYPIIGEHNTYVTFWQKTVESCSTVNTTHLAHVMHATLITLLKLSTA